MSLPFTAPDTETELIRPACLAPKLVCVSVHHSEEAKPRLYHHSDPACERDLGDWFTAAAAGKRIIVGHNFAYDVGVLVERYPDLRPVIRAAYRASGVTDTMIRARLIDTARGRLNGYMRGTQWQQIRYDLQSQASQPGLNFEISKDAWRTSYGYFLDYPLERWPERARELQGMFAARLPAREQLLADLERTPKNRRPHGADAAITALKKEIEGLREAIAGDPNRATDYPKEDATATLRLAEYQEAGHEYLHDQYRQARAALGLHLQSAWGFRTDADGIEIIDREITLELEELQADLIEAGLVRADGSRDTKAAKERMIAACKRAGVPVIRTKAHVDPAKPCRSQCVCGKVGRCRDMERGRPGHRDIYEDFDHPEFCREHIALDRDACEAIAEYDDVLDSYSKASTLAKVKSNDLVALSGGVIYPVHTRYGFASTGRTTSCIAAGTPVQTPCDRGQYPQGRPIEEIRAGDYVYSYDLKGNLYLQRVLWAGCTGVKPVVELKWSSQGQVAREGLLKLTADHRVMTLAGKWVEAGDLKPGDRVTALSCREKSGYMKLYARGGVEHREHVFANSQLRGMSEAVHHIDRNPKNNAVSNLEGMTHSDHAKRHAAEWTTEQREARRGIFNRPEIRAKQLASIKSGPENANWLSVSRWTLLRWAALAGGRLTKIKRSTGHDYEFLTRRYELAGIDLSKVRARYTASGEYLSKRAVREIAQLPTTRARTKAVGANFYRFQELVDFYGLSNNHTIVSVKPAGESAVFDIEVEHTHSFIAGEICVHNSGPNIQNQSKRDGIREAFIARPGYVFIECDYPQLELYTLAQCCVSWFGFSKLAEVLLAGKDPHLMMAATILRLDYDVAKRISKDATHPQHELVNKVRQQSKPVNFGRPGGMGADTLMRTARKQMGRKEFAKLQMDLARAEELCRYWEQTWPEMRLYFARVKELVNDGGGRAMVETLFTKRWRGQASYCATANNGFQALGADCAKNAVWLVAEAAYFDPTSSLYNTRPNGFVHDEIIAETPYNPDPETGIDERAHAAANELARLMVVGANEFLPDVPIALERMEPVMMMRWYKAAKSLYVDANDGTEHEVPGAGRYLVPAKAVRNEHDRVVVVRDWSFKGRGAAGVAETAGQENRLAA